MYSLSRDWNNHCVSRLSVRLSLWAAHGETHATTPDTVDHVDSSPSRLDSDDNHETPHRITTMPPAPTLGYDRVARGSAASDQRVLAGPPAYHPKPLFRSHTPGLIKLSDSHLHNSLYIHILHALLGTTGKPQGKIRGEVLMQLRDGPLVSRLQGPVRPALCREQRQPSNIMPFVPCPLRTSARISA